MFSLCCQAPWSLVTSVQDCCIDADACSSSDIPHALPEAISYSKINYDTMVKGYPWLKGYDVVSTVCLSSWPVGCLSIHTPPVCPLPVLPHYSLQYFLYLIPVWCSHRPYHEHGPYLSWQAVPIFVLPVGLLCPILLVGQ